MLRNGSGSQIVFEPIPEVEEILPYCSICCIACKTPAILERHIKFSELHSKELKKLEMKRNKLSVEPLSEVLDVAGGSLIKLLYSGSKLFYKTSDTMDITLYYHILHQCVEVIVSEYDGPHNRSGELKQRIYLDYNKLLQNIEHSVADMVQHRLHSKVDHSVGSVRHYSPRSVIATAVTSTKPTVTQELHDQVTQEVLVSFILNRIQIVPGATIADHPEVYFACNAMDAELIKPELPLPLNLVPVRISIKRKINNAVEISKAIEDVDSERTQLHEATDTAETLANAIFDGIYKQFHSVSVVNKSDKYRLKWQWAIRLVIRQLNVTKYTNRITEFEKKRNIKVNK